VDVAVHPIEVPEWADCACLARSPNLAEEGRFRSKNIGAGNRTYTVGLWKILRGDKRNQPFVYSGHIGLVPEDERVPADPWLASHNGEPVLVEAYLVEGEPLDGASGSPVFVRRTIPAPIAKETAEKSLPTWKDQFGCLACCQMFSQRKQARTMLLCLSANSWSQGALISWSLQARLLR
jgi:hypothetical protein